MDVDRVVHRVAEGEGVTAPEAARHAHAVFHALREAVGDELLDVKVQLPDEYIRTVARYGAPYLRRHTHQRLHVKPISWAMT